MTLGMLEIISLSCMSSIVVYGLIPGSWALDKMLNIPPRCRDTGTPILGFSPYVKMGAYPDMKSPT